MEIVRAVRMDDLDNLWELIGQATYGLTTLQIDREQLRERVELSSFAFTRSASKPSGEPYVFVMEDTRHGQLVGLCCIFSKTGGYEPFYTYRRVVESRHNEWLGTTSDIESLHLEKIHDGPTEIGSLFLMPEFRGQGRGRLLSLSRFAFIAMHPARVDQELIAEMRGVLTAEGDCPFWNAIGRHFFQMEFPQADTFSTINKRFIENLMPQYPIYTSLLPTAATQAMGRVHPNTEAALAMLQAEGFRKTEFIDIFDGGPVVKCRRDQIGAVNRSELVQVQEIADDSNAPKQIVASQVGGFRAVLGRAVVSGDGATLDRLTASQLQVQIGDQIAVLYPYPDRQGKAEN